MFASSLLAASSLLFVIALADSSPFSKFIDDADSLLAAATGTDAMQLNALYQWQATQTAVPSSDVDSQYQDYLDAYITTTSTPLPSWVTAIPSSIEPIVTSFLQAEASLVAQDIAPIVSQNDVDVSAYTASQTTPTATSSSNTTVVSTPAPSVTASSGFATGFANSTTTRWSGNETAPTSSANGTVTAPFISITTAGGSPTKSVKPPVATFNKTNGAEKQAGVAVVSAMVGILGLMALL